MAIEKIDAEKCVGCGTCIESCPADVFRMDEKKGVAYPKYPQDCVTCCWCLGECPAQAVIHTNAVHVPMFTSWG
jgi:NAD-dependent dihydropyrimidine dehydrogenase PreA subunit